MANQRVFEIRINGLTESYEGVKKLVDVLNQLGDKDAKVASSTEQVTETQKKRSSSTDALTKAQEKLNNYDEAYEKELAAVKAELSANQKEIKAQVKIQEAQAVVEAKQLDTYKDKQTYLSALNTLIRNHSTATEEDNNAIRAMVEESAALQNELKEIDAQMEIYSRNVGNYNEAAGIVTQSHQSLKQELKEVKNEMAEMLLNGVSKTDEAFLSLAERAGQIKDAMSDAGDEIAHFASDTSGIDNVINLASTATAGFSLYQSTMAAFGMENDEVSESMQRMMAAMSALQALQRLQNNLTANGSATAKIYTTVLNGVKSMLGLKTAATQEDISATEQSITASETEMSVEEAKTSVIEGQIAAKEAEIAVDEAAVAAKESMAAATQSENAALATNNAENMANTTSTQANTAAKQDNATATNTMSTANKTATASQTGLSTAQKAGAVASKILGTAMKSIPLFAIIGLVTTLIDKWEDIWNWFKDTFPVIGQLSKAFDGMGGFMNALKATAVALGKAIINWVTNPFKTLFKAIKEVLAGNFSKAIDVLVDGFKNQFSGTAEVFRSELKKNVAALEEQTAATMELDKLNKQIELNEAKGLGNTRENLTLLQRQRDLKIKMAKDDDERHKAEVEYQKGVTSFRKSQEQSAKTSHSNSMGRIKQRQTARTTAHNQAMKEQKEREDAAKKSLEEYSKLIEGINKKITQSFEKATKAENAVTKHEWDIQADYAKFRQEQLQKDAFQSMVKMDRDMADWQYHQAEVWFNMRKVMAVNSYGQELEAAKQTYKKELDFIAQTMRETNAAIDAAKKRGDTETVTSLEEKLDQLDKAYDRLQAALTKEFGRFWDRSIILPVEFDFDTAFKEYVKLADYLQKNATDIEPISFDTFVDTKIGGVYDLISQMNDEIRKTDKYYYDLWQVLELSGVEAQQIKDILEVVTDPKKYNLEFAKNTVIDAIRGMDFYIDQTSGKGYDMMNKLTKMSEEFVKGVNDEGKKAFDEATKYFTEQIKSYEDYAKKMQDVFKSIRQNPVRREDMFSGQFGGDIIDRGATRKSYEEMVKAAENYYNIVKAGSEERIAIENEWQKKLNVTKMFYGEESKEYKNALSDRDKAFNTYAANEIAAEEQLQKARQKLRDADNEYYEDLSKRMKTVADAIFENVINPISDTFAALFSMELDEMNDFLEKIEKALEDATSLREESASKIEEINSRLRDSDNQNLEALRQRLADEEVLLTERQAMERRLQLEKEDQEARIQRKEKQQKKAELLQSMFEGIANTAVGVTAALKYGPILGPIFAAIIGAMGAAQVAIIGAQINKLADGGLLKGASHSQGGMRILGSNIEVEGGEYVVNKRSTKKYLPLLEQINAEGSTKTARGVGKYAQGGRLNIERASQAAEYGLSERIMSSALRTINMRPVVSVTDINRVNNELTNVEVLAGRSA